MDGRVTASGSQSPRSARGPRVTIKARRKKKKGTFKKIRRKKFRHKDASLWQSTATVKYYMVSTSADPS